MRIGKFDLKPLPDGRVRFEIENGAATFLDDQDVEDLRVVMDVMLGSVKPVALAGLLQEIVHTSRDFIHKASETIYKFTGRSDFAEISLDVDLHPIACFQYLGIEPGRPRRLEVSRDLSIGPIMRPRR